MQTRRLVTRALAVSALALLAHPGAAQDRLSQAAEFIRQSGTEFTRLAGTGSATGERRRRLQALVDRVVDVEGVARFCLGRFWRSASPAQQSEYIQLFHQVLLNGVAARMGDYPEGSARISVGRPTQTANGVDVPTTLERPGSPPAQVVWTVSFDGGQPRIVDVVAEGVSMRLTQRNDYTAFLSRNNQDVGALIKAMRQQVQSS